RHGPDRAVRRELGRDSVRADRLRQGAEVLRLQGPQPRRREARRVRHRRDLRPLLRPRLDRADHGEAARARVGRRRPVRHLPDDGRGRRDVVGLRQRRDPAVCKGCGMRKLGLFGLGLLVIALAAACGSTKKQTATGGSPSSCAKGSLNLVTPGQLTVGTDNPAFPPWYGGTPHSPWKVSDPRSGKGYESAVAYAVAKQLGFSKSEVTWVHVPFATSYAPGSKSFDFDINQISYTPARAKQVAFSDSYYDVNQSVVVNNGTKIASVTTVKGLAPYELGAQLGTTSYQFIQNTIKPAKKPSVFPTNAGAVQALKNKQIDGLVVDLPTAFYVTAVQVPNSKVLGQFPAQPGGEHFGLVLAKGNSLVTCVNKALSTLRGNGTLMQLQQQWLAKATGAPILM